jgi:predicted aminopeptidase
VNSSSFARGLRAALVVAFIAAMCGGCYEIQAVKGQATLMFERKPIARVIHDPSTPAPLRKQLGEVDAIRDFAGRELGLPDNGSYRSYADTHRRFVVWNVFAAPEFSVQAKTWCYPIVGCVAYRGYFDEHEARAYAERLRRQGFDVKVGGVAAYSTLGHFDDPILNTMLGWSDVELAAIIFHELTHELIYVAGDAPFNEALATLVEVEGVRRWLRAQGREGDLADFLAQQQHYERVVYLLIATRSDLERLYASELGADAMRAQKREVLAAFRSAYLALKAQWGGQAPFAEMVNAGINNADLVSISTYESCIPGLARELAQVHGDLAAFFTRARALARMPQAGRDAAVCAEPQQEPSPQ